MHDPRDPASPPPPLARTLPLRVLAAEGETPVTLVPDAKELVHLARHLGVERLENVALEGSVAPLGRKGWRLEARLRARVGQLCVVTLDPVETVVDLPVTRRFQAGAKPAAVIALDLGPEGEDEAAEPPEPLGDAIDLGAILVEELALAIDPYPRAPGAALGTLSQTPPGAVPLDAEPEKPFAGLAGLRAKLAGEPD